MTAFALLDLFSFGNELIYCIHGTPKASVFPDPVSATPITSRPSKKGPGSGLDRRRRREEFEGCSLRLVRNW
jgi:hypothetical protein